MKLKFCYRLLLPLLILGLLVGCQSSRPAFYFGCRPTAATPVPAAAPPDSVLPAAALAATPPAPQPSPRQPQQCQAAAPRSWPLTRPLALRPLVRQAGAAVAKRPPLSLRPQSNGQRRSAAPVVLLLSVGALAMFIALGIGTLDAGLVASIIGLACLAAVALLLLGRTIWPQSRSAARGTAARTSLTQLFVSTTTRLRRFVAGRQRAARPADGGIDALGRFIVKAAAVAASVFLLTLILGLVLSSTATTVIGAAGLGLLLVLAILILSA